ncbi:SRPBCC family protein [Croceicoccus marinus]|uniref:SRPBCC family protein n=1 Tax=Croceicoccus marinus TaxID=450378 RepID=A0A1Z1F9N9_9SPHN|nr:SRPBCC domain-containing protein [Croceicoccus marinus]ARU15519.1 hypothetical protein A9D14_04165 [Croceicoccus marinus]
MKGYLATGAIIAAALASAAPAHAEIVELEDDFFVVRHAATVSVSRDEAWDALLSPSGWWNAEHSFSGSAENFSLEPEAGGCFCEVLPASDERPATGSVRHLEVVLVDPGRLLRLSGALGPLQREPLSGVLTITVEPVAEGTRMQFEYAVGGPSRLELPVIAPAVDAVIGDQLSRLAATLGDEPTGGTKLPEQPAERSAQVGSTRSASSIQTIEPDDLMPEASDQNGDQSDDAASRGIGEDFLADGTG